jgi:hypothetical protein
LIPEKLKPKEEAKNEQGGCMKHKNKMISKTTEDREAKHGNIHFMF